MADFNPDQFLAETGPAPAPMPKIKSAMPSSDFDPDKFLAETKIPVKDASLPSAVVRKGLQGATAGFLDEVSGVTEAAGRMAGIEGLGGSFSDVKISERGPTLDKEYLKQAYIQARDRKRQMLAQDSQDFPVASTASEIAGGILSPANKVIKGMSAVKGGAVLGSAYGLGNSEAEDVSGMIMDAGTGLVTGAAIGKVADVASPYVNKGIQKASEAVKSAKNKVGGALKDKAEEFAFKSTGAMLKDWRNAADRNEVNKIGRWLLDTGSVKVGSSVDDVANAAAQQKAKAGVLLDEIYTKSGDALKASGKGFDPVRDKERILAAAKSELGDTIGSDSVLNQLSSYIDDLAVKNGKGSMSPRRTNEIKGAFDEQINYSRNPLSKEPAREKVYSGARKELNSMILDSVDSIDDKVLGNALREANKSYGMAARVNKIAEDRVNRESANKMFGLTDNITGMGSLAATAATGNPAFLIPIAAKKIAEKYGESTTAVALDSISKRLLKDPQMSNLFKVDPKQFTNTAVRVLNTLDANNSISLPSEVKLKGEEKWVKNGSDKILNIDSSFDNEMMSKLSASKKGKQLLIKASDLKPGPELNKVVDSLKALAKEG